MRHTLKRIKFFVMATVLLWLVGTIASYASAVPTESSWLPVAFQALSHITSVAIVALVLWALWLILTPVITGLLNEPEPEPEPAEAPVITQTVGNLAEALAEAEQDSNKASILLADAETYATHLVKLVERIAQRADDMLLESDGLQQALDAIASQDRLAIARAAGTVSDEHVRSLMLCQVTADSYWQDTAYLINSQLGTLQQWTKGYRLFSSRLLADIAEAKARLMACQAALELTSASRPLLQIQDSLNQASHCLQIERRPGLAQSARLLPVVN